MKTPCFTVLDGKQETVSRDWNFNDRMYVLCNEYFKIDGVFQLNVFETDKIGSIVEK